MFTTRKISPRPLINTGLNYIIRHAENNKEYKGIDQDRLALITIKKESLQRIIVSVDIETEDGGEILVNKQKTIVHTIEEAINFFSSHGIGVISWIK